jgi:isoleucyl-tRNA synthetase
MAPVLSFTAEEIWQTMPRRPAQPESVFISAMPAVDSALIDDRLGSRWDAILKVREEVMKALELARSQGIIGHSLDAEVVLYPGLYKKDQVLEGLFAEQSGIGWEDVLIVSRVIFVDQEEASREGGVRTVSAALGGPVVVSTARGQKCERCWKYSEDVRADGEPPMVCGRCAGVLKAGVQA